MSGYLQALWQGLPNTAQDLLLLTACLLPAVLLGVLVTRGFAVRALIWSMLLRHRWTHGVFVLMLAGSAGLGVALIAQERGIRAGAAAAADRFDLVVTAPGNDVNMLLATVFLQPTTLSLLPPALFNALEAHPEVAMAAPLVFGDSVAGAPLVGTTAAFVRHLAEDSLQGESLTAREDAVVGAAVDLRVGDPFSPAHGVGDSTDAHAHAGHAFTVVGRLPALGNPWDRAVLVPVETLWQLHGLGTGKRPADGEHSADADLLQDGSGADPPLGPPYDADYFPGVPAIVVRARSLAGNYALRSEFSTATSLAFFPGEVLSRLYGLLGNVRALLSAMALGTQALVAGSVLTALVILVRLFARRLALLRALGAPRRFVFAVVWSYAATLLVVGSLLGVLVGYLLTGVAAAWILARLQLVLPLGPGWPELQLMALFVSGALYMALLPAGISLWRPVVRDLRG